MDGTAPVAQEAQAAGLPQTGLPQQAPVSQGTSTMPSQTGMWHQQVQHSSNIQQAPGIMYELDNKVVNLAEPGGLR